MKRKVDNRQRAFALCLSLVLLFPLFSCSASVPEETAPFVFGEDFPDFAPSPERSTTALYLQVSGVGAFRRDAGTLFPADTAELVDLVYLAFARLEGESVSLPDLSALPEREALQASGVRFLVSLSANAQDTSSRLSAIAGDEESAAAFARDLVTKVREAGLDGVDLDWEAVSQTARPDAAGMSRLCAAIRREGGEDFLLTCAVPCSTWGLGTDRYDFAALSPLVDYFNLMSYDLGKGDRATHLTPLYPSQADGGYGIGAVTGVQILRERGVKPGQILLGCTAYGKAYAYTGDGTGLGAPAKKTRLPLEGAFDTGTVQGAAMTQVLSDPAWECREEWADGKFVGSYLLGDGTFLSFDSDAAYREKLAFAREKGCGVMLWSYTQDTKGRFLDALRQETVQ